MAKKSTPVTVTLSVTPEALAKILSGGIKGATVIAIGTTQLMVKAEEPVAPKVYDESTCESIEGVEALSAVLDPLRGNGMIKRVTDHFKIDYSTASTLVSAEAAARKNNRDVLFVVPAKAPMIRAIVEAL